MKKALTALGIILSLPMFYVVGPIFLPDEAVALAYYSPKNRDSYLIRHHCVIGQKIVAFLEK